MQRRLEKDWDLTIGPDTVRLFILKAKALSAAVNEDYDDGAEHEVEFDGEAHANHHHSAAKQLCSGGAISRPCRAAAREHENVVFGIYGDPGDLTKVKIWRELKRVRNRLVRNLRH